MSGILTLTSIVLNVCCSVTCVAIIITLVNRLRSTGSESIKAEAETEAEAQDNPATSSTQPVEKTNSEVRPAFLNKCAKCHAFVSIGGTCSRCGTVNIKK